MRLIIIYDVRTKSSEGRRRLRRVARACEDYGLRIQKSVFECVLRPGEWRALRERLLRAYDPREDSLRIYELCDRDFLRIEHHGIGRPPEADAPLIF